MSSESKAKASKVPAHWPPGVLYITQSRYAASFPPTIRKEIQGTADSSSATQLPTSNKESSHPKSKQKQKPVASHNTNTKTPPYCIRRITSQTHPAYNQFGLFTTRKIPGHTFILTYCGEIHTDERPSSDYDLSLYKSIITQTQAHNDGERGYVNVGIDAQYVGNEARFINDYRGTGVSRPNAVFRDVRGGEDGKGELTIGVWSAKDGIEKGEEILVSYGKGWWLARKEASEDLVEG